MDDDLICKVSKTQDWIHHVDSIETTVDAFGDGRKKGLTTDASRRQVADINIQRSSPASLTSPFVSCQICTGEPLFIVHVDDFLELKLERRRFEAIVEATHQVLLDIIFP